MIFGCSDHHLSKPKLPTCCVVGAVEPQPTAWGGARPTSAHSTTTPSPRRACSVDSKSIFTGARSARVACHWVLIAEPITFRNPCRWPVAVLARSSLGRLRRIEHTRALAHDTTTPSPHCAARAPWAFGRYSTRRYACEPRATGLEREGYGGSKLVPPTYRGVGAMEPRLTAWRGARPALAHSSTTPTPHCAARVPWMFTVTPQGDMRGPRATGGHGGNQF